MESTIERGDAVSTKQYKMSTDIPVGIITPDQVVTRLGTLRFLMASPTTRLLLKCSITSTSSAPFRLICRACRRSKCLRLARGF